MEQNDHLVIDFGILSEHELWKSSEGRVDLLLSVANSFLEKIPIKLLPYGKNRVLFEVVTNGFLFFIIGARDELLQKINRKFQLMPNENDVTMNNMKNKLNKKDDPRCHEIYELFENCTQEPYQRNNYAEDVERSKSWLWELNHLRIRITHHGILFLKSDSRTIDEFLTLSITHFIEEKNPCEYFKNCYGKFLDLKKDIDKILTS